MAEVDVIVSPSSFVVRRAASHDTAGILLCLRTTFAPYQILYTLAAFEDTVLTPELRDQRLSDMAGFVAETSSEQIIGTIACGFLGKGEGHLRGMAVLPKWQRRGVVKALLARTETELKQRGCKRITLDTTEP